MGPKEQNTGPGLNLLEELCQTHWQPLYSQVLRRGYSPEDAEDLTQKFFEQFLSDASSLHLVNPNQKNFQVYLWGAMNHFLRDTPRPGTGSGTVPLPLDDEWDETLGTEKSGGHSPDQVFEHTWAEHLLDEAVALLKTDHTLRHHPGLVDELAELLWGKDETITYAEIGRRYGMNEGAVRGAMHRLRHHFRDCLRARMAEAVKNPAELEDELRHLIQVLCDQ